MKINIDVKGSFQDTIDWLNEIKEPKRSVDLMNHMGQKGVESLASHTPRATGETAESWGYDLDIGWNTSELSWYNDAHPHISTNIARLIYTGHGTGSGGYVPPRDYITPAIEPIFTTTIDQLLEEMLDG